MLEFRMTMDSKSKDVYRPDKNGGRGELIGKLLFHSGGRMFEPSPSCSDTKLTLFELRQIVTQLDT